jgi:16S rRNA (guanine527-N7)-methyltransferase
MPDGSVSPSVREVLADAQRLGFLGPGDLDRTIHHAASYAAWCASGATRVLDLGSGGGVPGLVVAGMAPELRIDLLEGSERRCSFLRRSIARLGWGDHVAVLEGRVEDLARRDELRGDYDVVIARSFGPPDVAVECASPFLRIGGRLVVSARPDEVWAGLDPSVYGMRMAHGDPEFVVLDQVSECPPRFPRRAVARRGS